MSTRDNPWMNWYRSQYLRSEEWHLRRKAVLQREDGLCQGCREARATQVHHRSDAYRQLREAGRELLCDLVALCDKCHAEVAHLKKTTPPFHEPAQEPTPAEPEIKLISMREDENDWRIPRLERVREKVAHIRGIISLEDWKGALTVVWRNSPDCPPNGGCVGVEMAWEDEHESEVHHLIDGEEA
jgi:hypothetical protein